MLRPFRRVFRALIVLLRRRGAANPSPPPPARIKAERSRRSQSGVGKSHRPRRSADEPSECGESPPEDPGAVLGTGVPRARGALRNRLHVPEGEEEGPAQAGPAFLLPDAGGERPPRVRRGGRRDPRQHVPAGAGALAGMAEAVPVDHPVAGDLRGARHAAAVPDRPEPGAAQRPGHPDDRRGHGTRRSSRTSSAST